MKEKKEDVKKISVINMKGGVGKTTLSIHLAYYLSKYGDGNIQNPNPKRVLLIDLDPQANASIVAIPQDDLDQHYKDKKTVLGLFFNWMREYGPFQKTTVGETQYRDYIYEHQASSHLHIIPSKIELSSLLKGVSIGPYELDKFLKGESPYREKIEKKYDFIIIDCAPTYSTLTTLALNASNQVLIPMTADPFGIHGTKLMQHVLKEHEHDFGHKPNIVGVIFTMWGNQSHEQDAKLEIQKQWPHQGIIFENTISNRAGYKILNGKGLENKDSIDLMWNSRLQQHHKDEFVAFVTEFLDRIK